MSPEELDKTVTFARGFYSILAEYVPGDTTVNELRILTELARTSQKTEQVTSVSDISEATGIPRATVSRLITKWLAMGRVVESPHPEDGRRHILHLTDDSITFRLQWAAALQRLVDEHVKKS